MPAAALSGVLHPGDVLSLRTFVSLHNLKLDVVAFLKAFVAIRINGAVVNKNIWTIVPADEAETFGVVKPFHFTFNSHVPYSMGQAHDLAAHPHPCILWDFATA